MTFNFLFTSLPSFHLNTVFPTNLLWLTKQGWPSFNRPWVIMLPSMPVRKTPGSFLLSTLLPALLCRGTTWESLTFFPWELNYVVCTAVWGTPLDPYFLQAARGHLHPPTRMAGKGFGSEISNSGENLRSFTKKTQKPRNQNQYSCKESKQTPFKDKSCTSQCFFSKASEKPDLFKQSKPILCQKNKSACCEVTINNVQHFLHLLQLTFINAQENSVMSCGDWVARVIWVFLAEFFAWFGFFLIER